MCDRGLRSRPGDLYRLGVPACRFCSRPCDEQWAVTVPFGAPRDDRWKRAIEYICPRCNRELAKGGREGRKLKGKAEWWYAGHCVGRNFDSRAARAMHRRADDRSEAVSD